jgi:maltose alpha-D-glucosyltransferase/alpha-amylase
VTALQESDLWWKNAVVYCLDPETYLDMDGDGIGDLGGLIERVDYLAGMGITCLWLMPFYPSPNRDDGYDITDFYDVDGRLGTLGDFVVLVRAAKNFGLRVIVDLVVNHTSDRHPWFRAARASRDSPYRDFYVWRDEPAAEPDTGVVFPDAEDSLWAWDERAGQWYLHHFYAHQPDLNIANPRVREEIAKIAGFWLQLGVDGFRVDAVPFLFEFGGVEDAGALDPHVLLKELRSFISRRRGDAVLLGEVNLPAKQLSRYFGDEPGDEIQLLFNFPVMQRLYLALARGEARPLAKALRALPDPPSEGQWAMFVRNHDELTLDQLSDAERAEVFAAFGPEEDMQLYGRGLRRRLPPMLDGDQQRMRLVYSLLFSLPGTPVLFYGEEIGMGENLAIPGRLAVRTPMQWSDGPTAGFSSARPSRLLRPTTPDRFGPMAVNVADQRRDPGSLLNWMERVIRRRREIPEIGWGQFQLLETGHDAVLAHCLQWRGRTFIGVHNLAAAPAAVRIDASPTGSPGETPVDDLLDEAPPTLQVDSAGRLELKLEGFGFRWLRLRSAEEQPTP